MPEYSNLYNFIRLVLGNEITNQEIARRWRMDIKNFSDFKHGKYPVPSVKRLVSLARVLHVDRHAVFDVASGTNAHKVLRIEINSRIPCKYCNK